VACNFFPIGDLALVIALAVMAGCNLHFAPRIKGDRIAMQWSFAGKPTWYASKLAGMWGHSGLPLWFGW